MKSILIIAYCLVAIACAKEVLEREDDKPPQKPKHTDKEITTDIQKELGEHSYTDDEIIALIKQELHERENNHVFTSTSAVSTEYDEHLSSTMSTSQTVEEVETTDKNKYSIDQVISDAWERFGDDIPAILKTIATLKQAKLSLGSENYNYEQYVNSIKSKIDELLGNYDSVYTKTNELIELIGQIYTNIHKNDSLRRLLQYNKKKNNIDIDIDIDIEEKAWKTFGDDISAIRKTMKEIQDSMNEIQYYSIDDEYKLSLKNKMSELLNGYEDVIANTNQLIEMIKGFYFITRK